MDKPQEKSVVVGLIVLVIGAMAIGMAAPLVKLSDMGPQTVGFWRMALAIPFALLWMWLDPNPQPRHEAPSGFRRWFMLALPGALFAGDLAFWHTGIKITTVANATFLANIQPVLVVLASWLLFKERPTGTFLIAAGLAVIGAALMSLGSISVNPDHFVGDVFSFMTAFWYAAYILAIREARRYASTGTVVVFTVCTAAPLLGLTALVSGETMMPHSLTQWAILAGLAIGVQIIGQGGVTFGLGRVPAAVASITILIQPVVAAFAGWIIFNETLSPIQYVGGALVLTGVWWVQRKSRRTASTGLAKPPPTS